MGRMVRKQIYITSQQERQLKQRATELDVSEAELIRRSLDLALGSATPTERGLALPAAVRDPEAFRAYFDYVESLISLDVPQSSWKFNREELYEERLSRWDRPPDR